jgi:hypothetical protein
MDQSVQDSNPTIPESEVLPPTPDPTPPVQLSPPSMRPLFILLCVVLFLAGIGGGIVMGKLATPALFPPIVPSPPVASTIAVTPTISDVIAGWKTYTDSANGFQLRYPPTMTFTASAVASSNISDNTISSIGEFVENKYLDQQIHNPFIGINTIKTELTPEELVNTKGTIYSFIGLGNAPASVDPSQYYYSSVKNKQSIPISTFDAVRFESEGTSYGLAHTIFRFKPGFLIDIFNHVSGVGEIDDAIYRQLVSSFALVDQTPAVAGLKTYKSSTYQFSYPAEFVLVENNGNPMFYRNQQDALSGGPNIGMSVSVMDKKTLQISFEDSVGTKKETGDKIFVTKIKTFLVSNRPAFETTQEVLEGSRTDAGPSINAYVDLNNGQALFVTMALSSNSEADKKIFEQMLSTLMLTQ